jgi:hypothetical protein
MIQGEKIQLTLQRMAFVFPGTALPFFPDEEHRFAAIRAERKKDIEGGALPA